MKVLHVHTEPGWGGGEKQLILLLNGINSEGVEYKLLCQNGSEIARHCSISSIPHESASFSIFNLVCYFRLWSLIREMSPGIIHAHTSKAHSMLVILSLFVKTPPIVVTRRMNNPVKDNFLGKFKYNTNSIRKIICVSQAVMNTLKKDVSEKKLVNIYGGINIHEAQAQINRSLLTDQYPVLKGKKVIGFIGSLTAIKDPLLFIKTAKKLHSERSDLMFVIMGDGPLKSETSKHIESAGLTKSFVLTGFLENTIAALSGLDQLIVTSRNEGIPNVILEAFACKVAAVAVNVGGIPELIAHEHSGLLSQRSELELAACSKRLLENGILRKRIIDGASNKLEQFDYRIGIQKTLELYENLIGIK